MKTFSVEYELGAGSGNYWINPNTFPHLEWALEYALAEKREAEIRAFRGEPFYMVPVAVVAVETE